MSITIKRSQVKRDIDTLHSLCNPCFLLTACMGNAAQSLPTNSMQSLLYMILTGQICSELNKFKRILNQVLIINAIAKLCWQKNFTSHEL